MAEQKPKTAEKKSKPAEKKPKPAEKKPKAAPAVLELTPIADEARPPGDDPVKRRHQLRALAQAPGGRVVGIRPREPWTDLIVVEPGADTARVVPTGDVRLSEPDISPDGARALCQRTAPRPSLVEIDLQSGAATEVPDPGPLTCPRYVIDQLVFGLTKGQPTLMRRTGEIVSTLDKIADCFVARTVLGGKYVLADNMRDAFLIAIKRDALHVVQKVSRAKEPISQRDGRAFVCTKKGWTEVTNLAALWDAI